MQAGHHGRHEGRHVTQQAMAGWPPY
jgi:hypothetical protein